MTLHSVTPGIERSPPAADERLLPPREYLDPRAKTMWYVSGIIEFVIWEVFIIGAALGLIYLLDRDWWWPVTVAAVLSIGSAIETAVSPAIRYRSWRYEIREDEVDLQHGVLVKVRQLVPMSRIQHVDTRRGPLQQRFGLSSVVFFTAAGSMEIPALSQEHAAAVRNRIAELAKVHDDL